MPLTSFGNAQNYQKIIHENWKLFTVDYFRNVNTGGLFGIFFTMTMTLAWSHKQVLAKDSSALPPTFVKL